MISIAQCYGQFSFVGYVKDEQNKPINRARLLLKFDDQLSYAFTNANGKYTFQVSNSKFEKVQLTASAVGCKSDSIFINFTKDKSEYFADFKLVQKTKAIEEVVIKSLRKPVVIKKDTVVYNTENFMDGTESNVEEVLKKLPGIKVNESGAVEFKGKTVVAVMLDGTNLFNSNYMTGTRNINPKVIDQIEAIENWSENPILKELNMDRKVALNLKLKKDKASFSSTLNISTDFDKKYNLGGYGLLVNSNIKSFLTANANNVAENKSPINVGGNSFSYEEYLNQAFQAPNVISNPSINTQFGLDKVYRNQQKFGSYNSVFKINKNINLKLISTLVQDKVRINNLTENNYRTDQQIVHTVDENAITKEPLNFLNTVELKWYKSKNEFVELITDFSFIDDRALNKLYSNINNNLDVENKIKSIFTKNQLVYTFKLDKSAIQLKALYAYNEKPQQVVISSSNTGFTNSFQSVDNSKTVYGLEGILHHAFSVTEKLTTKLGFSNEKYAFSSALLSDEYFKDLEISNRLFFNKSIYYVGVDYTIEKPKWSLSVRQKSQMQYQELMNDLELGKAIYLNNTGVYFTKNFLKRFSMFINGNYYTTPLESKNIYKNPILISNRNIVSNTVSLDVQHSENYSLGFGFDDTFLSLFKVILSAGYTKSSNAFASQFTIDPNVIYTQYTRLNRPLESYNFMLDLEKFVPFLSSRFTLKTEYQLSDYFTRVNGNDWQKTELETLQFNFIHQVALDFPFRLKNEFTYQQAHSNTAFNSDYSFRSINFKNTVSYSWKTNIWSANFTNEYYKHDLQQEKGFWFVNFSVHFSPKKSHFKYFLSGSNLLNEAFFYQTYIQDYGSTISKTEINPRLLQFGIQINF